MIKRPLCLTAVFIVVIQLFLTGVLQMDEKPESSPMEQTLTDGGTVTLSGRVYRREEEPKYQTYYLTDVQIRQEKQFMNESKILVYIEQQTNQNADKITIGNRIEVTGKIGFFEAATNPGGFDRKFYYRKQGIHASIWSENVKVTDNSVRHISESLTCFRIRWRRLLIKSLGEYYGNSMSAILLGDKSDLDEGVKDLFQKSGIGHILAISGLHMSFLGIGLYQLLRKTGLSFLTAGTIGMAFLILYTIMIGSGVSAQRALIMFIVRVGADMAGRDYDLPTSLALAAAVITLRNPLYLFDAGFLLSFGALIGIAAVNPVLEKMGAMPKMLCASVSVNLVLLPLILYYYFEMPLYSLVLNLLVIPLMSAVLGVGVFGSLTALLWSGGGEMLLEICRIILWGYEKAAQLTMELPFGRVVLGQPEKWWCALYYAVLFAGCAAVVKYFNQDKLHENKRSLKSAVVILYAAIFCLGCALSHGKKGELQVTAIDVGQGDGFYIRTPGGKHYLIDGGSTSESKVGQYRIEPFLKSQGVGSLDYVFVSHGDEDHMNGISELLADQEMGIQIGTVVFPAEKVLDDSLIELAELAEMKGTKIAIMRSGETITDGEMVLKCLFPSESYEGETGNASSMVLELDYREFEMLFTGDLEGGGERELLDSGELRDCDVLKAGHHGSKNSTSEEFLEAVSPEITMISAGKNNRYGHPHKETMERLEAAGSKVYCTKDSGAVTIITDGKKLEIESYLQNG